MNACCKKLNSKRGASFIIALVFMMICLVVASLIVIAAVSNISKSQNRMGEEQAYLAASSAAQLVAEELNGISYTAGHTDTVYHCNAHDDVTGSWDVYSDEEGTGEISTDQSAFAEYINQWTLELIRNSKAQPTAVTYDIDPALTISDDTLGSLKDFDTKVTLQMYGDFDLKATITASNGSSTGEMTISIPSEYQSGTDDVEKQKSVDKNADKHAAGSYKVLVNGEWVVARTEASFDIDHITYTRTINWGAPVITEGI